MSQALIKERSAVVNGWARHELALASAESMIAEAHKLLLSIEDQAHCRALHESMVDSRGITFQEVDLLGPESCRALIPS